MKRSSVRAALFLVGSTLILPGCYKQKSIVSLSTNEVAIVGTRVITSEAFQNELSRRAHLSPDRYASPGEKQALLEEMIRFEALYQKALAAGYNQDPEIAASLKRMIAAKYQADQLARLTRPEVTSKDIADYYRNNAERFGTPEQVRVALIELKVPRTATPEKRAEAAKQAESILAEARASAVPDSTFGLLAQNHSEDQASRYRGGDIGWLTAGDTNAPWDPAVLEAAFKLAEPGDLAPVVSTPEAFYLVKLVERQPAHLRPFEKVKDGIAYLVARQKQQQQLDEFYTVLKQGLKIQTNQTLLESIRVPVTQSQPPGVPGTRRAEARTP